MGVVLAVPISIVLVFLFVFYPEAAAIVLASFGVVVAIFFSIKGRLLSKQLRERQDARLDDASRKLVRRYPLFFGFYFGQRFFVGLLGVLQYLSIPLAAGLAAEGLWLFIPLSVVAFASIALSRRGFDPRRRLLAPLRRASPTSTEPATGETGETVRLIEETFFALNGFRADPVEMEGVRLDENRTLPSHGFTEESSSSSM